jgi:hypothetical protein
MIKWFKLQEQETMAWRIIKVSLMLIWFAFVEYLLRAYNDVPIPAGFCRIFPCALIEYTWFKMVITILMRVFAILYVLEFQMKWATLGIALISLIMFSIEESNGVYTRTAIFSAVFCVQALAYWYSSHPIAAARAYSIQVVAAGYSLAGISKVLHSGFWPADASNLLLQFKKGILNNYYNVGSVEAVQSQVFYLGFFVEHQTLLVVLLTGVLFLELFAFLALVNPRATVVYGILLLTMHIGIHLTMDIFLYPISLPMIILFLNPLYHLLRLISHLYERIFKQYGA